MHLPCCAPYRSISAGCSSLQVLPPAEGPSVLAPGSDKINWNAKIMPLYLETILPGITQPGDDANYGSSATQDVLALQVRTLAATIPPSATPQAQCKTANSVHSFQWYQSHHMAASLPDASRRLTPIQRAQKLSGLMIFHRSGSESVPKQQRKP